MAQDISKALPIADALHQLWYEAPALDPRDIIEVFFEDEDIQDWDDVEMDVVGPMAVFTVRGAVTGDDLIEDIRRRRAAQGLA